MRYGYFNDEKREYVIERPDVPVSWTNYIGVRDLCSVLSHNAGGYLFYKSAEHHRITRFRQDGGPLDRPGHYVYIRDDDTGEYWSISWQPVGKDLAKARYECCHGLSYSRFSCDYQGIQAVQLIFIPVNEDVELWDVYIRNHSIKPRRLSVLSYAEFSYHHIDVDNQNLQMSLYASDSSYSNDAIEYDFFYEPWDCHYMTADFIPDSYDCLRDCFLGITTQKQIQRQWHAANVLVVLIWAVTTVPRLTNGCPLGPVSNPDWFSCWVLEGVPLARRRAQNSPTSLKWMQLLLN